MSERLPSNQEEEPKRKDAAQLADLLYYAHDREIKVRNGESILRPETDIAELVESLEHYIDFRAQQDPEMAAALVDALESFRDPDPMLATLDASEHMQDQANRARTVLGMPTLDLPTEPRVAPPTPDQFQ